MVGRFDRVNLGRETASKAWDKGATITSAQQHFSHLARSPLTRISDDAPFKISNAGVPKQTAQQRQQGDSRVERAAASCPARRRVRDGALHPHASFESRRTRRERRATNNKRHCVTTADPPNQRSLSVGTHPIRRVQESRRPFYAASIGSTIKKKWCRPDKAPLLPQPRSAACGLID